jgi:hypothetical protein
MGALPEKIRNGGGLRDSRRRDVLDAGLVAAISSWEPIDSFGGCPLGLYDGEEEESIRTNSVEDEVVTDSRRGTDTASSFGGERTPERVCCFCSCSWVDGGCRAREAAPSPGDSTPSFPFFFEVAFDPLP